MYEDDTPPAERRAQALSLDRDLLRELLGQEELRDLLDADAVDEVERQLQGDPKTPDHLHDKLRLRGDLRGGEYDPALAEPLLAERRAVLVRIAGEERLIAAEDAGRYRDALGVMPPSGLPDAFLEGGPESLRAAGAALCEGARALHDARGERALRSRGRRHPRAARGGRAARARRAASRGLRARVVRSRRASPAAPRVARRTAPRGRAGRAGGARALPALVARGRPARVAARGAGAAAGTAAARCALGVGGAAAPRARLPARAPRRAHGER